MRQKLISVFMHLDDFRPGKHWSYYTGPFVKIFISLPVGIGIPNCTRYQENSHLISIFFKHGETIYVNILVSIIGSYDNWFFRQSLSKIDVIQKISKSNGLITVFL